MDASFWHKCWERSSLGFHQEQVHPFLLEYFDKLIKPDDKHVFVPLCGKSLDMVWLAERLNVTGAELSEIACHDFFADKKLSYNKQCLGDFSVLSHDNLVLLQGDFFKLMPVDINSPDWIYDRAALIALPKKMQKSYANHLTSFIDKNTRLMLISLEFPEDELSGPPFPITQPQLKDFFPNCDVDLIASHELQDKRFAQRIFDVSYLIERLYIITLKAS